MEKKTKHAYKDSNIDHNKRYNYDRSFAVYCSEIAGSNPLSLEEEAELGRRIKAGDIDARDKLVNANLRFVVSIANEYKNRGRSLSELVSAGNIGLITAAERYDETQGYRFISYAVWWVRQAILQDLAQGRVVRLPLNRLDGVSKLNRYIEDHIKNEGGKPGVVDVAEGFGISVSEASRMFENGMSEVSLDATYDDDDRNLYEVISDKRQEQADEVLFKNDLEDLVRDSFNVLEEREADVLRHYFGLHGYPKLTLEKIGEKFGLTRERVRQIKKVALGKLRHPMRSKKLRAYYNDKAEV